MASAKPLDSVSALVLCCMGAMFMLMFMLCVAADCNIVSTFVNPCANFLNKEYPNPSPLPPMNGPCCQGVKILYQLGFTQLYRQQICQCLKNSAKNLTLNDNAVATLAPHCGITLGYEFTKNINCSSIP